VTRGRLDVAISNAAKSTFVPAAASIRKWVAAALQGRDGEVVVRIVMPPESARLNRRFRDQAAATNVLAFPAAADVAVPGDLPPLGDIVICAEIVASEASEQHKDAEAHWAHIVIHGALHLIGYDHIDHGDAEVMEARERELLAEFGIGDPYTVVEAG
jgi:probable rRNA maturation factor